MTTRAAINGYGRIGRCLLRAAHERGLAGRLDVVAVNELANLETMAYLTRYDSTHGRFPGQVETRPGALVIDGREIAVSSVETLEALDWSRHGVDLVFECTGAFTSRERAAEHLRRGARRVLFSQPADADVDATIVYGINHETLTGAERIVSNASCTTNAVVPVLDLLAREIGIEHVLLTTLHSVMNDQPLADGYHHADLRRTRSAMQSIIPVSTGLARGVERLLPQLAGRVQAKAIRVPTANVSAVDMVIDAGRPVAVEEVNDLLAKAAAAPWRKLLAYTAAPHASIDFNHDPHSAIIDGSQTRLSGQHMLNLLLWFDNEWGFANRLLDVACHWRQKIS